jgi:hypothetical protein
MKLILVGIQSDDGTVRDMRVYESTTWALKYGKAAGDAARWATVDVEFTTDVPVAPTAASEGSN